MINKLGFMENTPKSKNTSAKKTNDGLSSILNILSSNLGDDTSKGNASTIYNVAKLFM